MYNTYAGDYADDANYYAIRPPPHLCALSSGLIILFLHPSALSPTGAGPDGRSDVQDLRQALQLRRRARGEINRQNDTLLILRGAGDRSGRFGVGSSRRDR